MKILITSFSQSGNTVKIAKAISDEAAKTCEVSTKTLEEVKAGDLAGYDLVFIGSPIHVGSLAGPVKDFLNRLQAPSGLKMAGFVTHAGPAYPEQVMSKFVEPLQAACEKNALTYLGCFSCQGFLDPALHEMIKKSQKLTDDEWAERVKEMTGHPDAGDLDKAKAFTRDVLSRK
jgi:flavodoxin